MPRIAKVVDVPAIGELDRLAGQLSHQLAQALRQAIHRGDLKAGDLLPSTRRLSAALHLARGTVLEAFAQLTAEGFLEPQPGSGTRVAHYQAPRRTPHANVQASSAVAVPLSSQAQHLARFAAQHGRCRRYRSPSRCRSVIPRPTMSGGGSVTASGHAAPAPRRATAIRWARCRCAKPSATMCAVPAR